jgi:hypothetical protein
VLARRAGGVAGSVFVEPRLATALARAWQHGDEICIAGSLYLAGEALALLGQPPA